MNSGPLSGLSEIELMALQPDSIMPGKVNPVIPEAVAMVAVTPLKNDVTITVAGKQEISIERDVASSGYNLLKSIAILTGGMNVLRKAIKSFKVNKKY